VGAGGQICESEGVEKDAWELGFKFSTVHIDHIFIYQLPIRELMIPNVIDPNKIKMTSAGMVATAHLTIRTTIDRKGILMSVTTTLLESADILISS
jgi:hypothetical protein